MNCEARLIAMSSQSTVSIKAPIIIDSTELDSFMFKENDITQPLVTEILEHVFKGEIQWQRHADIRSFENTIDTIGGVITIVTLCILAAYGGSTCN